MAQKPPDDVPILDEDRRGNRLLFWSVLLVDHTLAFSEGRLTSLRTEDITQELPREEDMHPINVRQEFKSEKTLRSPFPFAAQMMYTVGPLINMLNVKQGHPASGTEEEIHCVRARIASQYDQLPLDMIWNAVAYVNKYRFTG